MPETSIPYPQRRNCSWITIPFVIIAMNMGLGITPSIAQAPGCQKKEDLEKTPEAWWDVIGGAVFKVYIVKGNEQIPRGTATLIDKRGYFVTASHIFEYPEDSMRFPNPAPIKADLLLVNHDKTIQIKAKEISHRQAESAPDLSLLKGEMTIDITDQVAPVDSLFDFPKRPSRYVLMGYKEKVSEPDFHELIPSQPISQQFEYIRSQGDRPYYGESGSLGINQSGQGVAILEGYEKIGAEVDRNRFKLVPLARGIHLLPLIDTTDIVKRVLVKLRQNETTYVTNAINSHNLSALELHMFVSQIIKEAGVLGGYFHSSDPLRKALRYELMCKNLFDTEDALVQAIMGPSSRQALLEGGSIATGIYRTLAENDIPRNVRRAVWEHAHAYFKRADSMNAIGQAPGFAILVKSKEQYAQYQAEYAYTLNEGLLFYPDMGISKEAVDNRIKLAIHWDNRNELAYNLAASGDADTGFFRPALDKGISDSLANDEKLPRLVELRNKEFSESAVAGLANAGERVGSTKLPGYLFGVR